MATFAAATAFAEGRGEPLPPGLHAAEVEHRVDAVLQRGRQRWPDIDVDRAALARHLGRVSAATSALAEPGDAWQALSLEDLYLAWGCLAGDSAALRGFEAELSAVLGAAGSGSVTPDELEQTVRTKLLVRAEGLPKLAEYGGRGRLKSWLRVVVGRTRVDMARRRKDPSAPTEAAWANLEAAADTPELELIRERHRGEFTAAFSYAVSMLSPRQRNCLRQRLFHGLKNAEIAAAHDVDVRTIKRWMASAREELLKHTRAWLTEHLGVDGEELDSLVRLIDAGVDLSVGRLLLAEDAP